MLPALSSSESVSTRRSSVARGALNAHFRRLAWLAPRYDELQSADRVTIAIQLSENQAVLSARRNLFGGTRSRWS